MPKAALAQNKLFNASKFKSGWKKRLADINSQGIVPVIDVESSYPPWKINLASFVSDMDQHGVALSCLSSMLDENYGKQGIVWDGNVEVLMQQYPDHFIPTTVSAIYPSFTEFPAQFLDETFAHAIDDGYSLLGEFEFRHYPSPGEYNRGAYYRDVYVPIDSEHGHRLFKFASETGLSFQIHYEVEDKYLPALESMLAKYPRAKVFWCHFGQVRYIERASKFGPEYIAGLIKKFPNLHFDLAVGGYNSIYPANGQRHSRIWENENDIKAEFREIISKNPFRFLSALDFGGDNITEMPNKMRVLRKILKNFDQNTQEILAYKSAWKLIFGEEIKLS